VLRLKSYLRETGALAATTIGAGMFGLPYVFYKSGLVVGVFYLGALSAILISVHILYWKILTKVDAKKRLLGLAREYLGENWYWVGVISVLAGLTLTLVVYLILGNEFLKIIWPSASGTLGIFTFWLISVLPLFKEKRILSLEFFGVLFMIGAILLIFLSAPSLKMAFDTPAFNTNNLFLPFGVVLFSLAGWTIIEPLYASRKKTKGGNTYLGPLVLGTVLAAALYAIFVWGILGSTFQLTPDTVSGLLGSWPIWKLATLSVLGLFAIWTSYIPIGLEIKNSLMEALGWNAREALLFAIFVPPILLIMGFNNFLSVIGLAGGAFLALQYVLIILVGKRVLKPKDKENLLFNGVIVAFLLAAVYEAYYFIVG